MKPWLTSDPAGMRASARAWRCAGERIALVPTMGDLHAGHLALVERAQSVADRVVVSIFVNPLQFGASEDYSEYPRVPERDYERLAAHGVDAVFAPEVESLYPAGFEHAVRVHVPGLEDILCGANRPGHFTGVATVVTKLFNTIEPDCAVFGEKDYQQLLLIRRLAADLAFAVEVKAVPTVRESDGLALSSRNMYLEAHERQQAPMLYSVLQDVAAAVAAGGEDRAGVLEQARARLQDAGFAPDYVELRRAQDLQPPRAEDGPEELRVLAAARLGRARLIDNLAVDRPAS